MMMMTFQVTKYRTEKRTRMIYLYIENYFRRRSHTANSDKKNVSQNYSFSVRYSAFIFFSLTDSASSKTIFFSFVVSFTPSFPASFRSCGSAKFARNEKKNEWVSNKYEWESPVFRTQQRAISLIQIKQITLSSLLLLLLSRFSR